MPSPVEDGPAPQMRTKLMDFGGALSNEGFKMRDPLWTGKLEPGQPRRLAVNLFRGNHYWFCASADPGIGKASVALFGPDGKPVEVVAHQEAGLAAAGVTAPSTGQYFVQVSADDGPASDFFFLYLFK